MFAAMAQDRQADALSEEIDALRQVSLYINILSGLSALLILGSWLADGAAPWGLFEIVLVVACGFALRAYRSRFLAIMLFIYAATIVINFVSSLVTSGEITQGGGIPLLLIAWKAVRATFAAAKAERLRTRWRGVMVNTVVCLVYELLFVGAFIVTANFLTTSKPSEEIVALVAIGIEAGMISIVALVGLQLLPFTRRATSFLEESPGEAGLAPLAPFGGPGS
jgi:hypothetical protein